MKTYVCLIATGDMNFAKKVLSCSAHCYCIVDSDMHVIHIECIVLFPLQQCLRGVTTVLRYTYVALFVQHASQTTHRMGSGLVNRVPCL
jgi:hypothetical protein